MRSSGIARVCDFFPFDILGRDKGKSAPQFPLIGGIYAQVGGGGGNMLK